MATGMSTNPAQRTIRLIGAPTDAGVGLRGACLGPQALRLAGLMLALQQQGWHVEDREDLQGPVRPMQPAPSGCGQLQEVHIWNRQVFDAVQESLDRGQLPVLLGGDHSLAIGSIAVLKSGGQYDSLVTKYGTDRLLQLVTLTGPVAGPGDGPGAGRR